MNKKQIVGVVVGSIVLSLLFVIFLSGYISAKLATNSYLQKFKIFQPQSPIVINKKEEIRISDSGDIQEAVNQAKSRVSLIVANNSGKLVVTGNAINLTSDGYYFTAKPAVIDAKVQYQVVQPNGRVSPIEQIFFDPGTNLAILKTATSDISVAPLGSSTDLVPGQKVVFVKGSMVPFSAGSAVSFISSIERDVFGTLSKSDFPSRTFGVQNPGSLIAGEALINLDGQVIGMWDGSKIIPGGILQVAQNLYFANKTSILRPQFGFEYVTVTPAETGLLVIPGGAVVTNVLPGSPAQLAGLAKGDTITSIGSVPLSDVNLLEEQLEKFKPADLVQLTVLRAGKTVTIDITAGTLK